MIKLNTIIDKAVYKPNPDFIDLMCKDEFNGNDY